MRYKNPLSASGQAPVASESVGAFPVRVALRAVAREKTACSLACSALRAEWNIGKSECREQRVYCFQDHTGATAIRRRVARNLCSCSAILLSVRVRYWCFVLWCYVELRRRGGVGGPTSTCPRRHVSSSRASCFSCVCSLWMKFPRFQLRKT